MKKLLPSLLLAASLICGTTVIACSPCGALSNVTQNVNGSNLELTFSSNAGWNCCYTVQIEIVCENANFSGVANYLSQEICINGGTGPSTTNTLTVPYPLTVIDLSNFCPGTYKWRAWEVPCNIYTPTQTFVVAGASPILLDVSATEDTICFGDNTQFSASASGGCNNGTLNYSWSPATGLSNANIANPVASPAVTTTYTCTVTESGSCTAPQTADLTIVINPSPNISPGAVVGCDSIQLPAIAGTDLSGNESYYVGMGGTGTAYLPGDWITSNMTLYMYDETIAPPICSDEETFVVTINLSPDIDPIAPIAGCGSVQLPVITGTNLTGNESYFSGIGGTGTAYSAGELMTLNMTLYVYDETGTVPNCFDEETLTVIINPLPTATISGTIVVCQGDDSPLITLTGSGSTPPYTINYTINGIAQSAVVTTGNSATVSVPTGVAGTFVYGLVDIQDASATLCSQNQTGTATITVNPLPLVDAGEDLELCEPNITSPSEIILSGSGALTYEWNNGAVNGVAFIPPGGVTVFTVTGTDANGCQNTDNLTVTSYPLPVANGAADQIYGNASFAVNFSNLSQGAVSYIWDFGDGNVIPTNLTSDVTNIYTAPGIYTVTLTASNGICYDLWTMQIEVIPPMVVTPPNVFTPNGDGVNDDYFVNVIYGEKFEAIILNRWGNLITTLSHLNQGWNGFSNGKMVEDGVYFIKYTATDFNGNEIEGHTYFQLIQ